MTLRISLHAGPVHKFEDRIIGKRQRVHVCDEAFPSGCAEQIELDVRRIEGGNPEAVRFEEGRHCTQSMRAGKVSDDGNQAVLSLELFKPLKLLFRREIVLKFSGTAGFKEHLFECRILIGIISADAREAKIQPFFPEGLVHKLDFGEIIRSEFESVLLKQRIVHGRQVFVEEGLARGCAANRRKEIRQTCTRLDGDGFCRHQQRQVLSPIASHGEESFEKQMLQHVLSSDVGDDCKRGSYMNKVRKILVRSDTEVDAARPHAAVQIIDHMKVRSLVGDEVIGVEVPFRFGPVINVPPQLLDRNGNAGRCLWLFRRPWYDARANNQYESHSNAECGISERPGNA